MIKLTLPVFLSLGKKNKFLSVTFSLVDEEKKTDALSRERRPIPQRSEFFFFFFFFSKTRGQETYNTPKHVHD